MERMHQQKWRFLALSLCVFIGSVVVLARLDLLPTRSAMAETSVPAATSETTAVIPTALELPMNIEIPAIGLSATIANPTTTDETVLDRELLKGAVRYPTSAELGEAGNVVLFGHSSYLPIVGNQAYKTFNGIQKLAIGDTITVSSSDTAYTYRVRSVAKESANDATIPLSVEGRVLTLSTCNSFASKADRFVVVADFVESHPSSS